MLEQSHVVTKCINYFLLSTSFQNLTKREFCKFYIIKYTHAPTRPQRKKEIFLLIHQSVFISKASRRLEGNESDVPVVRKKRKEGEKEEKGTISTRFTDLRRADSSRKLVSVDQVPSWRLKRTGVPTRVKRKPFLSAPRLSGSCPIMPFPASTSTSEKRRNSTWASHRNAVQEIRQEKRIYNVYFFVVYNLAVVERDELDISKNIHIF